MSWFRKKGLFLGAEERRLQKELQKPLVLSNRVTDKKNEVFEMIRTGKVQQEKNERAARDKRVIEKKALLRWSLGFVCAAVVFLGMGFYLNMTNPVLAQDLPVLGGIFKRIQEKSPIWKEGNVSEYAVPLQDENGAYTKKSNGVTVTVSEIYANPLNIYMSFVIKSEKSLAEIEYRENQSVKNMTLKLNNSYQYSFMDEKYMRTKWKKDNVISIDGILVNDHTFEGVLTLDFQYEKEQYQMYMNSLSENDNKERTKLPETFKIDLNLTRIGGRKAEAEEWRGRYTEGEYQALPQSEKDKIQSDIPKEYSSYPNPHQYIWFDGVWDFEIPITVDQSGVLQLENGIGNYGGVEKIEKTPQSITLYGTEGKGSWEILVLDADGYVLPEGRSKENNKCFLIEGYDISTVEIYTPVNQFYDDIYISGKWTELLKQDEQGQYVGEDARAVLEDYEQSHQVLHLE